MLSEKKIRMKAKTKAKKMVREMYAYQWRQDTKEYNNAKKCAIIAVNEIIKDWFATDGNKNMIAKLKVEKIEYWNNVKTEIEKL